MFLYVFLFLFGINFLLLGNYFLLVPFGTALIQKKRIRVNITTVILIGFVFFYLLSELIFGLTPEYRLLFAVVAFLLGYNFKDDITERDIRTIYLVLVSGMGAHVLLNFILAVQKNGGISFSATYTDFWTGSLSSTTGMMANLTLFLPTFVFAFSQKGKAFAFIPFSLLGLLFGVMTGNRSTIILFVVATIAGVIIILLKGDRRIGLGVIAGVILMVVFLILAYQFNWFGIKRIFDTSYLSFRIKYNAERGDSVLETRRWGTKLEYIRKMFDYPWGGGFIRQSVHGYAHDIWLDTWSSGGVFAFVFLVIYIFGFIVRVIQFIRNAESLSTKVLFTSYLVVLLLQFFVEPIIQGAPWLFISSCLIDGFITQFLALPHESYEIEKE